MPLVIKEEVPVPEGVEFKIEGSRVEMRGPKGVLSREFKFPTLRLVQDGRKIIVEGSGKRKREKAAIGTAKAHLRNMISGVTEGFTKKLRVVYSHFPITVKVEGKKVLIHNFLGERHPRQAEIVGETEVEVAGDEILVRGINKDDVGQTAINIERATAVRYRDRRIFQDGCFIVE
ncbi:MAG: 50S ribosomal protein L6 [Candidatus Hadarchaeales archaeon]